MMSRIPEGERRNTDVTTGLTWVNAGCLLELG